MKITLLQENLRTSLGYVSKAISTKPQLPILNSILLKVGKQGLELAATDLYVGIRTTVYGEVESEGSLVIPSKTFIETIQNLDSGKITLESDGTLLRITSGKSKVEINGQSSEEYPAFPEKGGQELVLTLDQLSDIDTHTHFSAGIDPTRMVLTSKLFIFKPEGLEVVSTDGFRLSVYTQKLEGHGLEGTYLIPSKAISEVVRIMTQEQATQVSVLLSRDLKQALCTINQTEVFVRLIEGEYPPYEKIIPASFVLTATWDGAEFIAQIKRAMVFARDSSNIIKLSLEKDKVIISARSSLQGNYAGEMDIQLLEGEDKPGELATIAFNAKYLQDFLSTIQPETIWFGMNESLKPAIFRPHGEDNYSYIVMPFRVNEGS